MSIDYHRVGRITSTTGTTGGGAGGDLTEVSIGIPKFLYFTSSQNPCDENRQHHKEPQGPHVGGGAARAGGDGNPGSFMVNSNGFLIW